MEYNFERRTSYEEELERMEKMDRGSKRREFGDDSFDMNYANVGQRYN